MCSTVPVHALGSHSMDCTCFSCAVIYLSCVGNETDQKERKDSGHG